MRYFIIFVLCLITQCKTDDDQIFCTEDFAYGLNITVKNTNTNTVITSGITVVAKDGDYEEVLMPLADIGQFVGAGERPGNYIIEITGDDYQTFISDIVSVGADECHVIGEVREYILQPN